MIAATPEDIERGRGEFLTGIRENPALETKQALLGDLLVRTHVPADAFRVEDYVSRATIIGDDPATPAGTYDFYWLDWNDLDRASRDRAVELADRTFRGQRFLAGFYLTHHGGDRAALFSEPDATYVIGGEPAKVFWSYVVKIAFARHADVTQRLHLKASAFVVDGETILVIGRGGGGKTFLTLAAAGAGATFVSNTHVLIGGGCVAGALTTIRVRHDEGYAWLFERAETRRHYEGDELLLDPADGGFEWATTVPPPSKIVIPEYSGTGRRSIDRADAAEARAMLDSFAWPMHTYGMKYDVWEMAGGSLAAFTSYVAREARKLDALAEIPVFTVDYSMRSPTDATALLRSLV